MKCFPKTPAGCPACCIRSSHALVIMLAFFLWWGLCRYFGCQDRWSDTLVVFSQCHVCALDLDF